MIMAEDPRIYLFTKIQFVLKPQKLHPRI